MKYEKEVIDGIKQNRNRSKVQLSVNIEEEYKDKFSEWRGVVPAHKFVPNHPLGVEGFWFQPYDITEFLMTAMISTKTYGMSGYVAISTLISMYGNQAISC